MPFLMFWIMSAGGFSRYAVYNTFHAIFFLLFLKYFCKYNIQNHKPGSFPHFSLQLAFAYGDYVPIQLQVFNDSPPLYGCFLLGAYYNF